MNWPSGLSNLGFFCCLIFLGFSLIYIDFLIEAILLKSNTCLDDHVRHCILLSFQGQEGPQGPQGAQGQTGPKVLLIGFSAIFYLLQF